jgi:hypothetical protein
MHALVCYAILLIAATPAATSRSAIGPTSRPATTRTTTTASATRPAVVFRSMGEVLATVPREIVPDLASGWTSASVAEANRVMSEKVVGERAALRFRIDRIERTEAGRYQGKWRIVSDHPRLRSVEPLIFVYCEDAQQPELARLRRGQTVAIRGAITHSGIESRDGKTFLVINLFDPEINK